MADKPLKSITFPGLADKYMIPMVDSTLTQQGKAADAKATGDAVSELRNTLINDVGNSIIIYGSELYPFEIPTETVLTVEEAQGNALPSIGIYFYNESKVAIGSAFINSSFGYSRTFTVPGSETVKYVYLTASYSNGIRIYFKNDGALLTKVNNLAYVPNKLSAINDTIGDNVIVSEAGTYYPFEVTTGTSVTIEEAQGNILPTATIYVYNAAKSAILSFGVNSTYGKSRTLTLTLAETGEYLAITSDYSDGLRIYKTDNGNLLTRMTNDEALISPDVMGYITSTEDLYAVTDGTNWYFKAYNMRLFANGKTGVTISWATITTNLSTYIGTSPDGTTDCLVLSSEKYLYYDWDNATFNIASGNAQIPQHSTILLGVISKQPYGVMWDYLTTTEIKRLRYDAVGSILTTESRYASLLEGVSSNTAMFGFFSDPHWLNHAPSTNYSKLNVLMQECKHLFDSTPIEFMCCGGDWMNNGGTKSWALATLGYINGLTHRFKKFYNIVGNHDTNYIIGSELTTDEVKNAYGVDYYSFDEGHTHYIALNTWTDDNYPETMDSHKWEQIAWLATELTNHENNIILLHAPIVKDGENVSYVTDFADNVTALADAYNNQTTATLNGVTYDFTNASGKVWCLLGGHQHANYSTTKNNIPIFIVANSSTSLNCYLVLVDYDNGTINFVSTLGSGSDWSGTL